MSKRCPSCGFVNEDSKIYCGSCGEPLDAKLRLLKDLDSHTSGSRKSAYKEPPAKREPVPPKNLYDENYVPPKTSKEKGPSPVLWIVLGAVAAVAVAAALILL